MMQVRSAVPADLEALAGLVRHYWECEGIDGYDAHEVQRLLRGVLADGRLGHVLLAIDDGRPVGYLLLAYLFSLEHRGLTAEVDEFFVAPAARGTGVGGRLLAQAEEVARARGCTVAALRLGRDNDAARRFYARAGYGARDDFDLLEKRLRAG